MWKLYNSQEYMWIYLSNGQLKWIIYTEWFTPAVCLSKQENILFCFKEGIETKPWIRNIIIYLPLHS
jgi:hypothetical protein